MKAPAAAMQRPRARLSVLFAASASKAVILRRGPRTHFRLIDWDLGSNIFTPGQWMKGVVHLCDLSPSGDKLIYWAAQYHAAARRRSTTAAAAIFDPTVYRADRRQLARRPKRRIPRYLRPGPGIASYPVRRNTGTWTAISTPPFFTALAIWPAIGTWTGGGVFRSGREIVLWEREDGLTPSANVPVPAVVRISAATAPSDMIPSAYSPAYNVSEQQKAVGRALVQAGAEWVDWVDVRGEQLLFAADGCVWRLERWASVPPERYLSEAERLADFRDMSFEAQRAPASALRW